MTLPPAVPPPPPPRNVRHVLRIVGWNLLFILGGLLLIGAVGEAYLRLSIPFPHSLIHSRFVPSVGVLHEPNTESLFTNDLDYWTVQRANSLGFLDREPIDPAHAAESCHVTVIGDSFIEGREVPISDKSQVRLEGLAMREAPNLDVTTSAFGFSGTGQVNQLPFYDLYARHLRPDLMVLVFVINDLKENTVVLTDPENDLEHLRRASAVRDSDGTLSLRPVQDEWKVLEPFEYVAMATRCDCVIDEILRASRFARWLTSKMERWVTSPERVGDGLRYYYDSPISREAWEATEFGLEQFKRRADHDGVALMILAVHHIGGEGDPVFDGLSNITEPLGIPVVSQHDYIIRQGGRIEDARWRNDRHWNSMGHQWAAEAIWEHIKNEWDGACPSIEPDPDIDIEWIRIWRYFYTPEGERFVDSFPAFNLDGYESAYSSVVSGQPVARSDWNVHLYTNGLTYTKEPCSADDTEKRFFLHVFPEHQDVLMSDRQSRGFDDLSFDFHEGGERFGGKCMVSIDLPEYEIESIKTGQFSDGVQTWSVDYNFALPEIMDAVRDIQQSGIEPDIRSDFDVYIDDGLLVYVKESCDADDRDLPFFLHVFPADENDLAEGRDESGFNNLGFELMQKGGVDDGGCFAAVDLPAYEIARIRTGQWVRGAAHVWEVSIDFAE